MPGVGADLRSQHRRSIVRPAPVTVTVTTVLVLPSGAVSVNMIVPELLSPPVSVAESVRIALPTRLPEPAPNEAVELIAAGAGGGG